jgi:DNA-binding phage protein
MDKVSKPQKEKLDSVLARGNAGEIAGALLAIVDDLGMTDLVRETGLAAETNGEIRLSTLMAVSQALGFNVTLRLTPLEQAGAKAAKPSGSMIYTVESGAGWLPWLRR